MNKQLVTCYMLLKTFDKSELKKLHKPHWKSSNEDNGQVTIIGGSKLFHGAPILALKVASRIVDMIFFASPESSLSSVVSRLKASLSSFIWVPWEDVESYIQKSDAVLIGPGFMRYKSERRQVTSNMLGKNISRKNLLPVTYNLLPGLSYDKSGRLTRDITKRLLSKFPQKKWVIDAGSLQVMDAEWIPEKAILTPNKKEFELLFNVKFQISNVKSMAKSFKCTIVAKGPETIVCSPNDCVLIKGGNPGMTKGGMGDVLAGLTVALLAKNDPFLAATAASYIAKYAADELYKKVGVNYNADDLADEIFKTWLVSTGKFE